jgi:type I restriction enzyme, S subunit
VILLRGNSDVIDQRYLFAAMRSPLVQARLRQRATGTTVLGIKQRELRKVLIPLPSLKAQRKIAAVLSAYDDIIENNRRRIQLLEEMAQRLYREWFVDFRYPGHDHSPMVSSRLGPVPRGWTVGVLADIVTLEYGRALKENDRRPGAVLVMGSSGPVGFHDEHLVTGPGIVVGRKGNAGAVHWVDADFYPIDTVFYVVSEWPLLFLLYALRDHRWVTTDTAVPGVSRQKAYLDPMLVPPRALASEFANTVAPIRALIRTLDAERTTLASARDLLLPRLVSAEIDVENLDIPIGEAAA